MRSHRDGERRAEDQLEDLLEAYADARLMPKAPVLARMRARVLADAAAAAAARRVTFIQPARQPRAGLLRSNLPRRAFAMSMAAALTLSTGAAVMAAPPGSPFYNARLVIETVMLPSKVDDRLAALEDHLQDRLHEAEAAAAARDFSGLAAALTAYRSEMDASLGLAGDDAARLALLEAALAKHAHVLEDLATRLPEQSSIEHALEASQKAQATAKQKQNKPNGPPSDPGAGNRP
jgi:hypothetical protein